MLLDELFLIPRFVACPAGFLCVVLLYNRDSDILLQNQSAI
jgi:hypothetical protein